MVRHAAPSPVQLHKMKPRHNRYHAGTAELFRQPDPPAIDNDLGVLRHHLDLQNATRWHVRRRIGISRNRGPVRLFTLNSIEQNLEHRHNQGSQFNLKSGRSDLTLSLHTWQEEARGN